MCIDYLIFEVSFWITRLPTTVTITIPLSHKVLFLASMFYRKDGGTSFWPLNCSLTKIDLLDTLRDIYIGPAFCSLCYALKLLRLSRSTFLMFYDSCWCQYGAHAVLFATTIAFLVMTFRIHTNQCLLWKDSVCFCSRFFCGPVYHGLLLNIHASGETTIATFIFDWINKAVAKKV